MPRPKAAPHAATARRAGVPSERLQHGRVVRRTRFIDEEAASRLVWQGLDTTGIMLARGSISEAMKRAADLFHDHFRRAGFDALRGADPGRTPVRLVGARCGRERGGETARLQVLCALDALGGIEAPGGACAWHVLGLEESLKMWAAGCRINHQTASGILIADLGILQQHWGL